MRVCRRMCRLNILPAVEDDNNKEYIIPEQIGFSQSMRDIMKKFVTSTCNFNPVEQAGEIVDVGLKIDAAPWSVS